MKKLRRIASVAVLFLVISWLIIPQNVAAAGNELDTLLARTTAKGYLTNLKISSPTQLPSISYYTTDEIAQSEVAQQLRSGHIDTYDIIEEMWLSDQVYQAIVIIEPSQQMVNIEVSQMAGRWLITSLDWLEAETILQAVDTDDLYPSTNATVISSNTSTVDGTLLIQPETGGAFYQVNADGTDLSYLSTGIDPALSPDGTQIAFTRWTSGGDGSVWIYNLTTGTEWQLLGETQQAKSPTWSPDGTQLVVNFQHGGQPEIKHVVTDLSERPPHGAYDIQIGSESGKLSYKLPADPHWQLRLIDVATGTYEDLPSATYSMAPTWDPANDWRIIFETEIGLHQLDLNRGEYFAFSNDLRDNAPVISPDGNLVAVTYKQHDHWEIYTINTTDGTRTRLTESDIFADQAVNSAAPAWSPDGSQIVFVTDRTGQWEFWIMDADGSNQQPLLSSDLAAQLVVQYNSVDERLADWR